MGAKGFAKLLVVLKQKKHTELCQEDGTHIQLKDRHQNPLYEHSENSTKILGGRNERITENQNQA